ncbi:MAG: hypothetical protein M0R46_05355 [Candidatus Muirbacterium halophilum]|nr:hypothetical protein [Candidatus Muirbacterium halophilum]MCK9475321.1 hypothetical protein [Candidatus Muirbacterium halophilum]
MRNFKKGFAYFAAILFGLLIIQFSYCVKIYKEQSAHLVDYESESYIAYMVAESGLNCAIAELEANFEWRTDSCEIDSTTGDIIFKSLGKTPEFIVTGNSSEKFTVSFDKNCYTGKMSIFDDGDALFKVRAGIIKSKDNSLTSIDESSIFYAIRSLGKFGEEYKQIEAIVEISYVNRFILFDGDSAVVCYGGSGRSSEDTILAKGDIYSKNHLMIGTTQGSGLGINLLANPHILTGKDGYISFPQLSSEQNNIHITTKSGSNYVTKKLGELTHKETGDTGYKASSTRVREVLYGDRDDDSNKKKVSIYTHNGLFKDKNTGGKDLDISYESTKSLYKKLADGSLSSTHGRGVYLGRNDTKIHREYYVNNKYSGFASVDGGKIPGSLEVMIIDFGDMLTTGTGDDFGTSKDWKIPGSKPSDYNGVIYAEVPLVIFGNPDRDTIIYSEYDIYVAGDFNQRQKQDGSFEPVRQNYNTAVDDEFGWNLFYDDYLKYRDENSIYRQTHDDTGAYWNNVDLISETRIFYDLTDPKKAFKNELIPFLVYEIYERLFFPVDIDLDEVSLENTKPEAINIDGGNNICEEARKFSVMYSVETAYSELNSTKNISFPTKKSVIGRIYEEGIPSVKNNPFINNLNNSTLYDYFQNVLYFSAGSTEIFVDEILDSIFSDGKLQRDEIFDIVENKIWPSIGNKAFVYVIKSGGGKKLGLAARLYEKTGIKTLDGNKGIFHQSINASMKEDMLYIPEMTVNAKRISMGVLVPYIPSGNPPDNQIAGKTNMWDCDSKAIIDMDNATDFAKLDQIRNIKTIREVIGNNNNQHSATNNDDGMEDSEADIEILDNYYRYISTDTFYLRTFGSEVYLRNMSDISRLPYIGGGYGPHIRKKVFDPENRTRYELRSYNLVNIEYYNIKEKDFKDF